MVMSVTPMVCVTLAFGLGYIGLTLTGGCCDRTYGAAHVTAKRVARLKNENRLCEIIWALLRRRIWPALCNAGEVNGKRWERIEHRRLFPRCVGLNPRRYRGCKLAPSQIFRRERVPQPALANGDVYAGTTNGLVICLQTQN